MNTPRIGAHVSAAGGVRKLWERVEELGVEAVQMHPSAPQSFRHTTIPIEDQQWLHEQLKRSGLPLYFHSIYLINLANPDDRLWHAALSSIEHYLQIGAVFGAVGTVTHLGSHKGLGLDAVRERLVAAAKKLEALPKDGPALIIENTAGGGGTLGRDIAELKVLWQTFSEHVPTKICLDTCHLFAAGVPVHQPKEFDQWLTEFDREIGLQHVTAVHLNDSKTPFSSNRDRHANLGEGEIGEAGLQHVLTEPRLAHVNFVLEVPGIGKGPDVANIERAKSWRKKV